MDTWQASGDINDVRRAREIVSLSVRDQREETRDAAVLLADECVANAVRHGGGRFELTVQRRPGTLRVEVMDRSPRRPVALAADPTGERGRGLTIVSLLSRRWGSDQLAEDRKVVWFELTLD
jgi:anti-sigma regulatory factor (Ser/Thr protein kinase)